MVGRVPSLLHTVRREPWDCCIMTRRLRPKNSRVFNVPTVLHCLGALLFYMKIHFLLRFIKTLPSIQDRSGVWRLCYPVDSTSKTCSREKLRGFVSMMLSATVVRARAAEELDIYNLHQPKDSCEPLIHSLRANSQPVKGPQPSVEADIRFQFVEGACTSSVELS